MPEHPVRSVGMALVLLLLLAACWPSSPAVAGQAAGQDISLPAARAEGGMPLMEALKKRRSAREFSPAKLDAQVLSDLLWAAAGINRPETGRRTAPSAKNWQEVDLYVILEDAAYLYDAKAHRLVWVASGDLRPLSGRQGFVNHAPMNLLFVSDLARLGEEVDEDKLLWSASDVGFISQNVYLFCASRGLNTVVRAGMDKPGLVKALGLRPMQRPMLCQTVGYPPAK